MGMLMHRHSLETQMDTVQEALKAPEPASEPLEREAPVEVKKPVKTASEPRKKAPVKRGAARKK
jgi:hypothetical protein